MHSQTASYGASCDEADERTCLWAEKALVSLHGPQALLHSGSLPLWKYHTLRVAGHWDGLPRALGTATKLREFQKCLNNTLGHMVTRGMFCAGPGVKLNHPCGYAILSVVQISPWDRLSLRELFGRLSIINGLWDLPVTAFRVTIISLMVSVPA